MHNIVDVVNRICKETSTSALKIFFKISGDYLYEVTAVTPSHIRYEQMNVHTQKRASGRPTLEISHGLMMKSWELTPAKFKEKPHLLIQARFK